MIEFLKTWVMNIVALSVFIVLLEILIPSGKTKKFVNLISGFVLIIAIINPLLGLINKDINLNDFQITDSNFLDKKEIEASSKVMEVNQIKQIVEVYRQKLIKQLENSANEINGVTCLNADVIINEDYKSDSFGEIKRAYIKISRDKPSNESISEINDIRSVQIEIESEESEKEKKADDTTEKKIKDKIKIQFGLDEENIVVTSL